MSKTLEELGLRVPEGIFPVSIARAIYEQSEDDKLEIQKHISQAIPKVRDTDIRLLKAEKIRELANDLINSVARLEVCEAAVKDAREQLNRFSKKPETT